MPKRSGDKKLKKPAVGHSHTYTMPGGRTRISSTAPRPSSAPLPEHDRITRQADREAKANEGIRPKPLRFNNPWTK